MLGPQETRMFIGLVQAVQVDQAFLVTWQIFGGIEQTDPVFLKISENALSTWTAWTNATTMRVSLVQGKNLLGPLGPGVSAPQKTSFRDDVSTFFSQPI
jgi:hypothetical protein